MLSFLDEVEALKAIRNLFNTSTTAKLAVAFWGSGAITNLGLDRDDLDVEVICNLDSGACNPIEIDALRRLRPLVPVRSDPRLHGKVYWTPNGVVLGSSNASTNGLAVEMGLSGWAEANIFSNDPKLIEASYLWFETRRRDAYEINDEQIALATKIWKDRARTAPTGTQLGLDLGAVVRGNPAHPAWPSVKLAVYSEDLSDEGKAALNKERRESPILRSMDAYERWHNEIHAGDWLLDFYIEHGQGEFQGYWHVPTPKIESKLLTYVSKRSAINLAGLGVLKLTKADKTKLERAAPRLVKTGGKGKPQSYAMITIPEAIKFIDEHPETLAADRKAFGQAMLNIFKEASKIGYRPTEFLKMIEREDALSVAKRLIMNKTPSSGFTRLWELKRPDLTVEAVATTSEWRHLFSEEELERAERRLKQ